MKGRSVEVDPVLPKRDAAVRAAAELDRLGVPRETVAFWVKVGALTRGTKRGEYVETALAKEYLGQFLAGAKATAKRGRR